MKVQELIDKLNAMGGSQMRLSRPGDPELSGVFVSFNPILIKSKTLLQQEALEKETGED
jgi:hypothetical protein